MATVGGFRVLILISSYSSAHTGRGGHYYSVRDLALSFSEQESVSAVHVLAIGDIYPVPFASEALSVSHVNPVGKSVSAFIHEVIGIGHSFSPTHVHSFDNKSHFFGRWIAARTHAKTYLTRPGGPNRRTFFPFAPDIVCFSEENLRHLRGRRNLRGARLHLIPQRVRRPVQDADRINELRKMTGSNSIILRICRISGYYRMSIRQTLALAESVRARGVPVSAVILGFVQDEEVLQEINDLKNGNDFVVVDPKFTDDASELVAVADAVVGTGRSLVEAALVGSVVLTPLAGSPHPVLVTSSNWRELAETNFSERNTLSRPTPSLDEVVHAIQTGTSSGASAVAAEMGIESAVQRYIDIYRQEQVRDSRRLDFALNAAPVVLHYAKTVMRSLRSRGAS